MSTVEREAVAAAIRQADICMPLADPFPEAHALNEYIQAVYVEMADAAITAHLQALRSNGYAVVKLPEPTSFSHFQESVWDIGESSVVLDRWNQVSIHLDDWDDAGPRPAEVCGLAAALLAAELTRSPDQQQAG